MLKYEQNQDGTVSFRVNSKLYPLKAIYRAAYLFTDRYYIGLDLKDENYIISFSRKDRTADYKDVGEFQNELLNQSMKTALNDETRDIRKLIVTRALYSAFIPDAENEFLNTGDELENQEIYNFSETPEKETEAYDLDEIAQAWCDE